MLARIKSILRENVYGAESRSCSFRFEVGKEGLTFYFTVNDKDIISPFEKDNEDIWQADAVEVFLSADGKLTSYKEMELRMESAFLPMLRTRTEKRRRFVKSRRHLKRM